ncbi:ferritin family protein [Streptomyces sp. NPDC002265]|uniref:ferritin family protein n=1 Tax=Streptomyces sp. NPDC002265 TaxID=3154415 RepID=UPI00333305B0
MPPRHGGRETPHWPDRSRAPPGVELHEHFAGEAVLAGPVRTTKANLSKAITGEHNKATALYPGFAGRATTVGDTATATCFRNTAADEAKHSAAFQQALNQLR